MACLTTRCSARRTSHPYPSCFPPPLLQAADYMGRFLLQYDMRSLVYRKVGVCLYCVTVVLCCAMPCCAAMLCCHAVLQSDRAPAHASVWRFLSGWQQAAQGHRRGPDLPPTRSTDCS
jgi:hypothetical protein